ncbi:MAG: uracil-DNA glycosylase [Bacillota bacterium]|jgi:uracil-DNA glycosylase family 4|nr:uracil-DNA glycosylase [Bacillota bacterium]NLV62400.1 uracil-DNA glycosylase [Clostridiaceae bacterium]
MKAKTDWDEFVRACKNCTGCGLAKNRNNVVIGRGTNLSAKIMLIGEGPGEQEDLTGQAFVGRAGKLLDLLMDALMFDPDDYYICNIVKCRPPGNREPLKEEAMACLPWLRYQVRCIKPEIIVCLGSTALKYIVDENVRITRVRGNWIERPGFFRIMPTYHPSAALRDPNKKEEMYDDMKKVREYLKELKKGIKLGS